MFWYSKVNKPSNFISKTLNSTDSTWVNTLNAIERQAEREHLFFSVSPESGMSEKLCEKWPVICSVCLWQWACGHWIWSHTFLTDHNLNWQKTENKYTLLHTHTPAYTATNVQIKVRRQSLPLSISFIHFLSTFQSFILFHHSALTSQFYYYLFFPEFLLI